MRHGIALITLLCVVVPLSAGDWPQWLGPTRNGVIPATIAPWKGPLETAWQVEVGEGHSSPIIAAGMLILHDKAAGVDEEVLTAWDLTGKQLWQARNQRVAFTSQFGVGPRATPTYAAGKVYTVGVTGLLFCRDAQTGKELWSKNLLEEFDAVNLYFGVSSSPLVDEKHVYVMPGGKKGSIVAFDKNTGELMWKSGTDRASYSSPTLATVAGEKVVIFQTERGVVGLDPANGKERFRIPLKDLLNESSTTPVLVGDLLFASSVTYGSVGTQLLPTDGKLEAKQVWKSTKLTCYFGTPVEFNGMLYVVTGQIIKPTATLHCIDPKTGDIKWSKPGVGTYHATLLRTKDKLLMLEEKGNLVMLSPSTESYQELARTPLCQMTWAHPAYADGLFAIRDAKTLKVVKLK